MGEVLSVFKKSRGHLALVVDVNNESTTEDPYYELKGIITLEDIMEEILGETLLDETDQDEGGADGEMDQRERELARLKMLSGKVAEERLSPEEAQAITSHLTTNVPQISRLLSDSPGTNPVTPSQVQEMVTSNCKVIELSRKSHPDAVLRMMPSSEDILYKRNKPSNVCTLVLSGRVTVQAGKDLFRSELGPWSLLGADSLDQEDGSPYVPDYTAFVSSDTVRCLLITKANVQKCLLGEGGVDVNPRSHRKKVATARRRSMSGSSEQDKDSPHSTPMRTPKRVSGSSQRSGVSGYGQLSANEEEIGGEEEEGSASEGGEYGLEMTVAVTATESPLLTGKDKARSDSRE